MSRWHVECPPEKNLVMKAYRALEREVSLPPVDIYLRKIIPDGAGLGGGSADAAFTLKVLNDLFALGYTDAELARVASGIGADCPFSYITAPCCAQGPAPIWSLLTLTLAAWTYS